MRDARKVSATMNGTASDEKRTIHVAGSAGELRGTRVVVQAVVCEAPAGERPGVAVDDAQPQRPAHQAEPRGARVGGLYQFNRADLADQVFHISRTGTAPPRRA